MLQSALEQAVNLPPTCPSKLAPIFRFPCEAKLSFLAPLQAYSGEMRIFKRSAGAADRTAYKASKGDFARGGLGNFRSRRAAPSTINSVVNVRPSRLVGGLGLDRIQYMLVANIIRCFPPDPKLICPLS